MVLRWESITSRFIEVLAAVVLNIEIAGRVHAQFIINTALRYSTLSLLLRLAI